MAYKTNTEAMNISIGVQPVAAHSSIFRAFIFTASSVNGVTEAQLAGLAKHIVGVDVAN